MSLLYTYGGAASCSTPQCSHMGLWVGQYKNTVTPGVSFDTGIFSNVVINAPANGVAYQQEYAYAAQIEDTSAGGYGGVVGGEIDIALHNATDVIKEGWGVASVPLSRGNDQFQGTLSSDGYGLFAGGTCGPGALAGGSGCAGFNIGLQFGRWDSYWPIADNGTVIAAVEGRSPQAKMKAQHGLDLHMVNFSGFSIYVPGFTVSNPGSGGGSGGGAGGSEPTIVSIAGAIPSLVMNDTLLTPQTQGLVRWTDVSGAWRFQFNTAVAADFSTVFEPIIFTNILSGVQLPNAATGTPVASLCLDASNNIIKKTTAGSCI
jgi:hypothetical protein